MFEPVHTVTDYYDGPRGGVADFNGKPHLYEAEWNDESGNYADSFLLTPLDSGTFALAMEDWAIWKRWEDAFHQGLVDQASHPALPHDHSRHLELQRLLSGRLVTEPARAVRKRGDFRPRGDASSATPGLRQLEVRWYDPA